MKNTNKILSLLISILLLTQAAFAASVGGVEFTSAPEGWTVNNAVIEDGVMTLAFDTSSSAARGKSEIITSKCDFSSGILRISFDSVAIVETNGDKIKKSISLEDGIVWNATELLNIKSGEISFFGDKATIEAPEASITIAVDTTSLPVKASAWVDDELIYSGSFDGWKAALNISSVAVAIKNNATASVADVTEWTVSNFNAACFEDSYEFTTRPEDGKVMISPADYEGIELNFGTIMSDTAYDESNYTLIADGEKIGFELTDNGTSIVVKPEGGLLDLTAYELTIGELTDIFGNEKNEDKTIAFTTAFEGYTSPVVTSDFDFEQAYYTGQEISVPFDVSIEDAKVYIYADGELVSTLNQAPYIYDIKMDSPAEIELQAIAEDLYGGNGYSEKYLISICDHNAPVITVSGIEDGSVCDINNLPEVIVTGEDDNGIEVIEFYCDGHLVESFESATAGISLESLSGGEHIIRFVARDIYGKESSAELGISMESVYTVEAYRNDFSSYKGKNSLPEGCQGGPQRGYLDVAVIDEAYGNSLIVGIETADENFNTDNTAYVGFPGGGKLGETNVEFDLYINERPADLEKNRYRMSFRTANSEISFFLITANEMQFCSSNFKEEFAVPYEVKTWYHIRVDVNPGIQKYQITVTDGADFNYSCIGSMSANCGGLNYFRVFAPAFDDVPTYAAVDNMVINQKIELPEIVFEGDFDAFASSYVFSLTTPLTASELTGETVTLRDEYGQVPLESVVSTDGVTVTITPKVPLRNNMDYTMTISGDVHYSVGYPLGVDCVWNYKTPSAPVDVISGSFSYDAFNFTASNTTSEDVSAVVVAQAWKDDKVTGVKATPVTLAANTADGLYTADIPAIPSGGYVTVYIWDSITTPAAITHRIYKTE